MISTKDSVAYTGHALKSFFEQTPFSSSDQFLLVDNDGSLKQQEIKARHPQLEVITNEKPLGFGENANRILEIAGEERADLFLLNNDLVFSRNWLTPLLLDEPVILSPISNRELCYNTPQLNLSVAMKLEDYLGKEDIFLSIAAEHVKRSSGYLKVIALPFFCVKIPYRVFSIVGKFDSDYGRGGGEDYDYCLRAYLKGLEVKYAQSSYVLHFGGKSSWSGAESNVEQLQREAIFFKHFEDVWGKDLADIILREKSDRVMNDPRLRTLSTNGELRGLIEALRPQQLN